MAQAIRSSWGWLASVAALILAGCGAHGSADSSVAGGGGGGDAAQSDVATDASGGQTEAGTGDGGLPTATLTSQFVTTARSACTFSSPLAVTSHGQEELLIVTADGVFSALNPATGAEVWHVALAAPAGLSPHLASAPALIPGANRVVFAWQDVTGDWTRMNHHVGVLDLEARALDPLLPALTISGSKPSFEGGVINFVPAHAYARSAVAHAKLPGHELGLAYVSYGNVRDLQPWHGWVFEIDLDAWKAQGAAAAITGSLMTTSQDNCGPENGDGARQMVCGGGIWSHLGPQVVYDDEALDGFRLLVATGNGALDPIRGNFANSILRTGHGLKFEHGCDPSLCEPFDILSPGAACMESCQNLFMPRLTAGQAVPEGPNGACVGRSLLGCYQALDWDLGANAPAVASLPGGPTVIVQPGKDGSLYLVDAQHLGTLYDRLSLMEGCGEGGGTCQATWAGTMVTRPEIVTVNGTVLALVPTFVEDDVHPAGLQAVEISASGPEGHPHLIRRWQAPNFSSEASVHSFRHHAGGVSVVDVGGQPFAAVVDTGDETRTGRLYWIRVTDGTIVQTITLAGKGQRYLHPTALNGTLYVPSCEQTGQPRFNEGPSRLEAFAISP